MHHPCEKEQQCFAASGPTDSICVLPSPPLLLLFWGGKLGAERRLEDLTWGLQNPLEMVPTLFDKLRERYKDRPGGYTRVLRIEPLKTDQAPSAILELVDGPKDMRFALTAKTIARCEMDNKKLTDLTRANMEKVTRFRKGGKDELRKMVAKFKETHALVDHALVDA